ncbi:MAG: ferritin-like domain-containing protein [Acidimicrobiales bacterium]
MSENFYTANASLAGVDRLGTEEMQTIWRVEMAGELFYNLLAERIDDAEAKDLLRRNAVEERGHARRIARALSIALGGEWEPSAEQQEILDVPMPGTIDARLFAGIVQGELNGDAGYQKWADNEPNPEIARLLRLNGREETIHANRAQRVLEILSS